MSETKEQQQPIEETENVDVQPRRVINPATTIFVGNVAHEATVEDLENVFKDEFGSVEIDLPNKEHHNKAGHAPASKHALVIFPQEIDYDAIKAKYDTTVIHEREIHIKRAKTADQLRNFASQRGGYRGNFRGGRAGFRGGLRGGRGGSFRGGRGGFRGGRGGFGIREKDTLDEMERSKDTLYVNNLPYSATAIEIAELFGTKPELIVLPKRRMRDEATGKLFMSDTLNRGIAFVTFEGLTSDIADKRDELQGRTLQDRELVIDVAVVKPKLEEESKGSAEDSEEQKNAEEEKEKVENEEQ
ncbi:Sbp1p NDAI_0H00200 [Naumovozyma dairenensis CBS 421]|uniref:RRM domain-containing protein n=1 Tax=Naumovozyma dairenensis (strain ATCC 10597 / BCRC 20456 / CBS 421 / NBRC 0211 / NRRL Y-12639) TaxID=1071378 RepID=G0WEI3_NAUDC|nr:hypothetical protein NDAI_0H00200 [Naumovozyma dairenensis CBS 421]CCD26194.1 hypothetical protein NDAI_0H00200 [Naumovozyma dairenensis CBS 421]